jgi:hypothetical protein
MPLRPMLSKIYLIKVRGGGGSRRPLVVMVRWRSRSALILKWLEPGLVSWLESVAAVAVVGEDSLVPRHLELKNTGGVPS